MFKPSKCCEIGTYEHTIPMPISGKVRGVDLCIAPIVAALNAANIKTTNSCCGHGQIEPSIILEDGRYLVVLSRAQYLKQFNPELIGKGG